MMAARSRRRLTGRAGSCQPVTRASDSSGGEQRMTVTYTFDVFTSLDGFGTATGDWTGYWGKQGPEFLQRRLDLYSEEQRMVLGGTTFREFIQMLREDEEDSGIGDPWVTRMRHLPMTVVSNTLKAPPDWPNATVEGGAAAEVVARLKEESKVPLPS